MATPTKITLSDKELSMVMDAEWILTKQAIIQKVYDLFAERIPSIKNNLLQKDRILPSEVLLSVPKIYKGENYLQLPYVMLDYPRCFHGGNTFAIRTMFWWGNFFSITLHLAGTHKIAFQDTFLNNTALLNNGFYIGVNEDQWAHHFMEDNYLPCEQLSVEQHNELFTQNDFIKLAIKFDLEQWNNMHVLLDEGYAKIAALIF